jgi:hypothetical protein
MPLAAGSAQTDSGLPDGREDGVPVRTREYPGHPGRLIGRSTMTQVTIGLQLGGQAYSEVVFFKTAAALENFKSGRLKLNAQASAVALTARGVGRSGLPERCRHNGQRRPDVRGLGG